MKEHERNKATKPWSEDRPMNYYSDCADRPRPCPWVGCKHHLLLDVNEETGTIVLNVGRTTIPGGVRGRRITETRRANGIPVKLSTPGARDVQAKLLDHAVGKLFDEFDGIIEGSGKMTCVLDCVEGGDTHTLEEVGELFGVTRERIRQIESRGRRKLKVLADEGKCDEWTEMKR